MDIGDVHQLVDFVEVERLKFLQAFVRTGELLRLPISWLFAVVLHRVEARLSAQEQLSIVCKRPFDRIAHLAPLRVLFRRYPAVFPQLLHLASKAVEIRVDYRLGDPAVSEVLAKLRTRVIGNGDELDS